MFNLNVGTVDRIVRAVLGILLIVGFFVLADSGIRWLLLVLGLVALGTAAASRCPLYSVLGMSTLSKQND